MQHRPDLVERHPVDLIQVCSFWVDGLPQPQGSKDAFMPRGKRYPIVRESVGPPLKKWRGDVHQAAEIAMINQARIEAPEGAKVFVILVMKRPSTLPKNKPTRLCIVNPDADKCLRAIGDAMTKVCYLDDALVTSWHVDQYTAEEGEPTGALITVYREVQLDV